MRSIFHNAVVGLGALWLELASPLALHAQTSPAQQPLALVEVERNMRVMEKGYEFYLTRNVPDKADSYLRSLVAYIRIQSAKYGVSAEQLVSMAELGGPEYWKVLQQQAAATPAAAPSALPQDQGMECLSGPDGRDMSCFPRK